MLNTFENKKYTWNVLHVHPLYKFLNTPLMMASLDYYYITYSLLSEPMK